MAKGHTYFWRKPGRRGEERKRFSATDVQGRSDAVAPWHEQVGHCLATYERIFGEGKGDSQQD